MSKRIKKGIIASPGIKIGKAAVFHGEVVKIPKYNISDRNVDQEIERFNNALQKTKDEIYDIQIKISNDSFSDLAEIFSTHLMALEDPIFTEKAREKIKDEQRNAEWVVNDISLDLINSLGKIDDEYFKERIIDISDINKRLIGHLQQKSVLKMSSIEKGSVVFASNLTPSETAIMNRKNVLAFVTDHGGKTSHTAIMARSMNIPAIVGMDDITSYVKNGDIVIVDAVHSEIIINPTDEEIAEYAKYESDIIEIEHELEKLNSLPSQTIDNVDITIYGNIEIPEEMEVIKSHGAQGIGLLRSEFLFLGEKLPDEESQFKQYSNVADFFKSLPVTIRTIDVGGDKIEGFTKIHKELNPFLGCRSIRFSLKNPEIFITQIRAILRASVNSNINIMFPMISTIDELLEAKSHLFDVMKEFDTSGIPYNKDIKVGMMVEVPSAVISADIFADHVDFFSVGTNDLVQYVLAVDRVNEKVADLYNPVDISVLRYLKMIADIARSNNRPVSICGEMAGEPKYTMLLIGLGYRQLSMSSKYMYQIKSIIRSVTVEECEEFANRLLMMASASEIEHELVTFMSDKFPALILS